MIAFVLVLAFVSDCYYRHEEIQNILSLVLICQIMHHSMQEHINNTSTC